MLLLGVLACSSTLRDTGRDPPEYAEPAIVDASATCVVEDALWTFLASADAWTGNGQVVLSADGDYVERHPMYSNGAAFDGTSDSLKLALGVAPDFRNVVLGSTTVFNCDAEGLTGVLQVYARDGRSVADCRAFGDRPDRWQTWDPNVACADVLDAPDDTGG
jgi:hypothetical protein